MKTEDRSDFKSVSLDEFREAIRQVLLVKSADHAAYENRKPTPKERHEKWRLDHR